MIKINAPWEAENEAKNLIENIREANAQALVFLSQEEYTECFETLKNAEMLLLQATAENEKKSSSELSNNLATTFNNLGCYFLRKNKNSAASLYLQKAKDLDYQTSDREETKAVINLNLSVSFLFSNQYKKALDCAVHAENFVNFTRVRSYSREPKRNIANSKYKALMTEDLKLAKFSDSILTGICNYYIGLAYESLGLSTDAYLSFKKGFSIIAKLQENFSWNMKFISKLTTLKEMLKSDIPYLADASFSPFSVNYQKPGRGRSFELADQRIVAKRSNPPKDGHYKMNFGQYGKELKQTPQILNIESQPTSVINGPSINEGKIFPKNYRESPEVSISNKSLILPSIFDSEKAEHKNPRVNEAALNRKMVQNAKKIVEARRAVRINWEDNHKSLIDYKEERKVNRTNRFSNNDTNKTANFDEPLIESRDNSFVHNKSTNIEVTPNGRPRRLKSLTKVKVDPGKDIIARLYMSQAPSSRMIPKASTRNAEQNGLFQPNKAIRSERLHTDEPSISENAQPSFAGVIIQRIKGKLGLLDSKLSQFQDATNRAVGLLESMEETELENIGEYDGETLS